MRSIAKKLRPNPWKIFLLLSNKLRTLRSGQKKRRKKTDVAKTMPTIKRLQIAPFQLLRLTYPSLVNQILRRKKIEIKLVLIKRHMTLVRSSAITVKIWAITLATIRSFQKNSCGLNNSHLNN